MHPVAWISAIGSGWWALKKVKGLWDQAQANPLDLLAYMESTAQSAGEIRETGGNKLGLVFFYSAVEDLIKWGYVNETAGEFCEPLYALTKEGERVKIALKST